MRRKLQPAPAFDILRGELQAHINYLAKSQPPTMMALTPLARSR
jgi:hypothetical protein